MDFIKELLSWYTKNGRQLPMRLTKEPYKTWISEIIFQQTRLDQGLPYYRLFLNRFPDVFALANASEDEVLSVWSGLGYYSRARNLHHSAKLIVEQFNGNFPEKYNDIIKLKGIGAYTAAAIASWCFNEPKMAIDGNVYRVLARYFNLDANMHQNAGKKIFERLAEQLIVNSNPGDINQALIDLGATICIPANPKCLDCPVSNTCLALSSKTILLRPVKNIAQKVKARYFTYYVVLFKNTFLVRKRSGNDIWKGLYEFPLVESEGVFKEGEQLHVGFLDALLNNRVKGTIEMVEMPKHVLSHQVIFSRFIIVKVNHKPLEHDYKLISIYQRELFPMPVLLEKFVRKKFKIPDQ
jgi:A/G-specific adenine glycosylase